MSVVRLEPEGITAPWTFWSPVARWEEPEPRPRPAEPYGLSQWRLKDGEVVVWAEIVVEGGQRYLDVEVEGPKSQH